MSVHVREEREEDFPAIYGLIDAAFADVKESDHKERFLVERLRGADTFVPQLSLVAETDEGERVGYLLLTEVKIVSGCDVHPSLAVAPLAVMPGFQRRGIGGMLLEEAHARAASLGYGTAVLLGHKDYYPRFGYRKAMDFGIGFPFDVPCELCMVIELLPGAVAGVRGTVRYPDAFFGE